MDGMPNIKKWIIVYPVYINSKKTIAQGRRISAEKACENPNCIEIADCCSYLKLPHAVELDKAYPRDFMQRGRVRVLLKREDGSLYNPAIGTRAYSQRKSEFGALHFSSSQRHCRRCTSAKFESCSMLAIQIKGCTRGLNTGISPKWRGMPTREGWLATQRKVMHMKFSVILEPHQCNIYHYIRKGGTPFSPVVRVIDRKHRLEGKQLMLQIAELVPKHQGRTKKQEATSTSNPGPSKSGKGGKKKK